MTLPHSSVDKVVKRDAHPPSWFSAAAASVSLSVLFLVVYGLTNWITSKRLNVGVAWCEWEQFIPVVPWMIVPYMSIDAFFIAAPFLCRTRGTMNTLVQRLGLATIVAGACFLIFPLTLAHERPQMHGFFGVLHDVLKAGDRPHNLFPSLHVTYTLLLWPVYHQWSRGLARILLHTWFTLVVASVLFVHQHHVIDIVGGAILAITCAYIIPTSADVNPVHVVHRRWNVAVMYAFGAVAFLVAAILLGEWGVLCAWIGVGLAVITCAYSFAGAAVYRKSDGRIPWPTRLLLAPHMLGLHVTRRYWHAKASQPYQQIAPGVWLGRILSQREAVALCAQHQVSAALDMTAEHSAAPALRRLRYKNIPIVDLTAPTVTQLQHAAEFIQFQARTGGVYVFCGLGYSRSATAVAAYLLATNQAASVDAAWAHIRAFRPEIVLKPELAQALAVFHELYGHRDDSPFTRPDASRDAPATP